LSSMTTAPCVARAYARGGLRRASRPLIDQRVGAAQTIAAVRVDAEEKPERTGD
jgi:hypothetical protein